MEYKKVELKKYLECAKAVNTHGVSGMLKLENRCDSPAVLAKLKTMYVARDGGYAAMKVERASVQKNMVLVKFEGLNSFEDAVIYKNEIFYAAREDFRLRRGDHFIADIIGLPVFDGEREVGVLADVLAPAGQQVYVIKKPDGKTFMVPCVPAFIKDVSFGEERDAGIYVELIEGMEE